MKFAAWCLLPEAEFIHSGFAKDLKDENAET